MVDEQDYYRKTCENSVPKPVQAPRLSCAVVQQPLVCKVLLCARVTLADRFIKQQAKHLLSVQQLFDGQQLAAAARTVAAAT